MAPVLHTPSLPNLFHHGPERDQCQSYLITTLSINFTRRVSINPRTNVPPYMKEKRKGYSRTQIKVRQGQRPSTRDIGDVYELYQVTTTRVNHLDIIVPGSDMTIICTENILITENTRSVTRPVSFNPFTYFVWKRDTFEHQDTSSRLF